MLREFGGKPMASKLIALTLAEMIFKDEFGEEDFKTQLPLSITEKPDRWIVEGSRSYEHPHEPPFTQIRSGPAVIEILKRNCQVVNLSKFAIIIPK
jgi:hypothetical protein